jgi:hypothetical protein
VYIQGVQPRRKQIGSLLDKKERMNPNIQGSVKRNWMKFVLGVNIPRQKFLRWFDKEAGVKFGF